MSETDELLAGYEECRERLVAAVIATLKYAEPEIALRLARSGTQASEMSRPILDVTGIGLFVADDRSFILDLRTDDEKWNDQVSLYPARWKNSVKARMTRSVT